jgi:hypothetical protein
MEIVLSSQMNIKIYEKVHKNIKNARTGIRTRVEASTGLHDSPLHYPDAVKSVYLHDVSGTSECDSLHLSLTLGTWFKS